MEADNTIAQSFLVLVLPEYPRRNEWSSCDDQRLLYGSQILAHSKDWRKSYGGIRLYVLRPAKVEGPIQLPSQMVDHKDQDVLLC